MRGLVLLKSLLAALACVVLVGARADDISIQDARLVATEEGLALEADFAFELNPRLREAVLNGVPLYFLVEFELTRLRWWWFDEKTAAKRMQLRLSYHPLSRQYRLSTGMLQQQFHSLDQALHVLKRVRGWLVVERSALPAEANHEAAVRMRLDVSLLPKPFQVSAITSRDLQLESAWRRFAYRGATQPPAPVESREPREDGAQ
jgi:hypothetical protein